MIKFLDFRPLDAGAELLRIDAANEIYVLKHEYFSPARFKAGSKIWVKAEDGYLVYELTQSLPVSTEDEIGESIRRIDYSMKRM